MTCTPPGWSVGARQPKAERWRPEPNRTPIQVGEVWRNPRRERATICDGRKEHQARCQSMTKTSGRSSDAVNLTKPQIRKNTHGVSLAIVARTIDVRRVELGSPGDFAKLGNKDSILQKLVKRLPLLLRERT
jgi:hypothetical protein